MNVLRIFPENLDATTDYQLTTNPTCTPMKNVVGQTLTVKALALLEDTAIDSGEVVTFARIITDDGDCYGTSSKSFIKTLISAWDFADRRGVVLETVQVTTGTNKKGNSYLMLEPTYKG